MKGVQSSRHDLFAAVKRSGARVEGIDLGEGSVGIEGNGYYCRITVPWNKEGAELLARKARSIY